MQREYLKTAADASLEIPQDVTESVREIVDAVRERGDEGVRELTRRFDDVDRDSLRVGDDEIDAAAADLSDEARRAIDETVENVREFHEEQFAHLEGFEREFREGVTLGTRLVPVERAGVYVPGGRKPLVAARAGAGGGGGSGGGGRRRARGAPPAAGSVQSAQLYAMDRAGADEIYVVGGAQAVAAMAYGTETVPAVQKITGPGNVYVIEAKRQVYGHVGIDFLAGPTEVLIVADGTADPELIATDLLAQAEHDPRSRAILVATDRTVAEDAVEALHEQLPALRTEETAAEAWETNGEVVVVDDLAAAAEVADDYAPEHLQVMTDDPRRLVDDLRNYGSMFLGHHAPVVFGDKAVGTNHTLPTLEVATYTGGINVTTYLKVLTHQELTAEGADGIAPWAAKICEIEGTHAHQISAEKRITSETGRDLARDLDLSPGGGVDLSE